MSYSSFSPCEDWYYVGYTDDGASAVYRLAGWAIREGAVIGLISTWPNKDGVPQLVAPPAVFKGQYKHKSDLSQEQLAKAARG